ncbi:type I secretion system permease/ATPase [Bradyrhizobium sp. BWA-3-5]|uniref:type I secretion system permease/ATPase n=1 Tax=Bradyrhizobium sp. BWA-3-5 TaxID=3080013 RepID=UPI00293EED4E|nr:type I secretion system permease/ATPase [Bradyrhizobium sp. BWA-3-5]WOH64760.1 type I secretion system permease/ATPase [Bradyrhizobium sp. BWA-3-5]
MWGWDNRPGANGWRLIQHDEATASSAKIIPLRPWFDQAHPRHDDSPVKFAGEKVGSAEAKTTVNTTGPSSVERFPRKDDGTQTRPEARVEAKPEAKPEVKPEARVDGKTEAKTPPGSTVVIEQATPAPPLRTGGDKDGGGSAGGGGGGGGRGGGNSPPLHRRFSDNEFRDVLGGGLANARRNLVTVGVFSVAVNLLVLAIPIYLFNMSDRVLTSRSTDTLVMLTIIVIVAIAAHVLMDMMRRFILMRVAVEAEARLGGPVLSAAAKAAQGGSSREFQTLADLQHLRAFITGPVLLTMFDTPVAPVYFVVVFLIHPHLGLVVLGSGVALIAVALLNQRVTAAPFNQANNYGARANLQAESMARNAQVINAMGMIPEGVLVWGRETVESLKAQVTAQDRNILMTGVSKFLRLCTQIAILGWGAWLALEGQVTSGMVIAASIVGSRALAPLEGTIEGWRNFVQARSAYARIKALLLNSPLNLERLRLPRPAGYLNVERILYVPPPNKKVILNGISFQLQPGESLAIVGDSGTGKTMLARMLVGSIIPTAGSVRLDMMDLRNWDPRQFGESVGYLPQDVQLFPATIKANIGRMRDDARDEDVFDAAEVADVHEMISSFAQGYETIVGMDGGPLSGGQRQRIGLARAFFGNPRLLVLDEPNSNLDANGERALAKALVRAKEKQITVVTITQRAALLMSVDKIMILHQGSVQAFGVRDEIIPMITGRKPNNIPTGPGGPSLN